MTRRLIIALAGFTALALPGVALAQEASQTVTLTAEVDEACVLGSPQLDNLPLGDLTGADGRLDPSKTGTTVLQTTAFLVAWCNTPSVLGLNAEPLALTSAPAYATPTNFSRLLTYDATLVGWPSDLVDRPTVGSAAQSLDADSPHAAPSDGLRLDISRLQTLNAAGTVETAGLALEAGTYSGTVTVTLATAP